MEWKLAFNNNIKKQKSKLNKRAVLAFGLLLEDLVTQGPIQNTWPNYSKLRTRENEDKRHCHLLKGKPTYVCCWAVNKKLRLIEVYYVGTHENAPY